MLIFEVCRILNVRCLHYSILVYDLNFTALRAIDNFLRKQFSNPYDLMSDQELSGRLSSYISSSLVFICSVVSRYEKYYFRTRRISYYIESFYM